MVAIRRGLGIAAACMLGAVAGAVASACTLELDLRISCGDGYVDLAAGEECDPADPERAFEGACEEIQRPKGTARCDEVTCQIDRSFETCAVCGDGVVDTDAGEQCDLGNFAGQVCPGDAGSLQCFPEGHEDACKLDFSECRTCGNGEVDDSSSNEDEFAEECDPGDALTLATPRPCAGDAVFPGLASPFQSDPPKPYASGTYQRCTESCTWNRSACGYCGDGVLDDTPLLIDPFGNATSQPEECDGDAFSEARLQASGFWEECSTWPDPGQPEAVLEGLRPNLKCGPLCAVQGQADAENHCCVRAGEACPEIGTAYAEAGLECCYAYSHADEIAAGDDPCETVFTGGMIGLRVCRPFGLATE